MLNTLHLLQMIRILVIVNEFNIEEQFYNFVLQVRSKWQTLIPGYGESNVRASHTGDTASSGQMPN